MFRKEGRKEEKKEEWKEGRKEGMEGGREGGNEMKGCYTLTHFLCYDIMINEREGGRE